MRKLTLKSLMMKTPTILLVLLLSFVITCQALDSESEYNSQTASEDHIHEIIDVSEQEIIEPGYDRLSYNGAIAILADEEADFLNRTAKFRSDIKPEFEDSSSKLNIKIKIDVDYHIIYENAKLRVYKKYLSDLQKYAISTLEKLSEENKDLEATVALADLNLFGNYSIPTNYTQALKYYSKASQLSDDPHSNFMLGFIYSTGLFGQVEMNQAKALLHYKLAAAKGHSKAIMCLAYRYYTGFTVPKNLQLALFYYTKLAEEAYHYLKDGFIGTRNLYSYSVRVSDFAGGLYGEHASETRSTVRKRIDPITKDISLFLEQDLNSELIASHHYEAYKAYSGYYTEPRDYETAFQQASTCVNIGMDIDLVRNSLFYYQNTNEVLDINDTGFVKAKVASCAALLGHMYMRAEGCEQNFDESLKWLNTAFSLSQSKEAANDLGLLAELGYGVKEGEDHIDIARRWFGKSAQKYLPGKYNYIRLTLDQGLYDSNTKKDLYSKLEECAYKSNLESIYLLATLQENGDIDSKLDDLVTLYRAFVEKVESAVSDLKWAFDNMKDSKRDLALIGYAMAAEQGYETAQASVAYLLYPSTGLSEEVPVVPLEHYQSALNYYGRSSQQLNLDSVNFLGDLYYRGFKGNSFSDPVNASIEHVVEPNYEKAAITYQEAANRKSAQAYFNLGYLHEMGKGVPQDFYLAKRYYDLVLTMQPDSYIPVQISLWRLQLKLWWYKLTGAEVANGSRNDQVIKRTWKDWTKMYERMKEKGRKDLTLDIEQVENAQRRDFNEEEVLYQSPNTHNLDNDSGFEIPFSASILEDLIVPIAFLVVLASLIYGRIRRRNNNRNNNINNNAGAGQGDGNEGDQGENENGNENAPEPPRANFQFQVVFLPL